jgi:hypothetical protein
MTKYSPVGPRKACIFILAAAASTLFAGCDCDCISGFFSCSSEDTTAATTTDEVAPETSTNDAATSLESNVVSYDDVDYQLDGDAAMTLIAPDATAMAGTAR